MGIKKDKLLTVSFRYFSSYCTKNSFKVYNIPVSLTVCMFKTLTEPNATQEPFVCSADQDHTAQKVQTDLGSTLLIRRYSNP